MSSVFDFYDRRARLAPALLASSPVAAALIALAWESWPWAAVGLVVEAGFALPLADIARDRGKAIEQALWVSWGGPPLAQRLSRDDSQTTRAARASAKHLLESVIVPAALDDESRRIEQYANIADIIRHRVRQLPGNEVVLSENASYGYQRNLLGMRQIGLWASLAAIAASIAFVAITPTAPAFWACLVTTLVIGFFWLRYPSSERTRQAANRYADAVVGLIAASGLEDGGSGARSD